MSISTDQLVLLVKANVTDAIAGLTAVETKASTMGGLLGGAGRMIGAGVAVAGAAAVATGGYATKMALDFEESMAKIQALVGMSTDDMAILEESALSMGKKYGIAAEDAAGGLFFLTSAGLSATDATKALEGAAMASAIGLGDMESLSNTATTAMSNFGIDSVQAFDAIAKAAQLAKADPAELGDQLNRNSAAAALVGVEYDELAGITALMTRKMGDAAMSGTAVGAMLNKVVKPSKMAEEWFKKAGTSAADFKKDVAENGLTEALFSLNDSFAENGIAMDEWIGKVFEDSRGIKGAAALLGTGADEIDTVFQGMAESSGMVEEGWAIMSETGNVKLRRAFEAVKSALIPLGDILINFIVPALETFAGWLEKGATWLLNFIQGADGIKASLTNLPAPLEAVVTAFETRIGFIKDLFSAFVDFIGEIVGWWGDHWDEAGALFEKASEYVTGVLTDLNDFIGPLFEDIVSFIQDELGFLFDWWDENWPLIYKTVETILNALQKYWDFMWPILSATVMRVWGIIKVVIHTALDIIKGVIKLVMSIITGDWASAWSAIVGIVSSVFSGIVGVIKQVLGYAWDLLKVAWSNIEKLTGGAIANLVGTFRRVFGGIVKGVSAPLNTVAGMLESFVNGAIKGINKVIAGLNKIPGVNISPLTFKLDIPNLGGSGFNSSYSEGAKYSVPGSVTDGWRASASSQANLININVTTSGDALDAANSVAYELEKRGGYS